jgi:hypothetical protein
MTDIDDDRYRAERDYLQQRETDLRQQLRQNEEQLGFEITPDNALHIVACVVTVLRDLDQEALADEYARTFARADAARERQSRAISSNAPTEELLQLQEQVNEVVEAFERVDAKVNAWFERQPEGE